MKRFYFGLLIICVLAGCARPQIKNAPPKPADSTEAVKPVKPASASKPTVIDGVIFGKADFQGVLKVEYVKLMIVDENDSAKTYQLYFGDRTGEHETAVQPHYFYLELPASKYRITSISIPVGTTLATEKIDIAFSVEKNTVIYLGTLRVTGTDQKIRFGAVPIIRPGFDYKVDILNEQDQALREFYARYPLVKSVIEVKLMKNLRIQAY